MARTRNIQRDLDIVKLIDELGWSMEKTREAVKLKSKGGVHKAYHRMKKDLEEGRFGDVHLSTV